MFLDVILQRSLCPVGLVLAATPAEELNVSVHVRLVIVNNSEVKLHGVHIVSNHGPLASGTEQCLELIRRPDRPVCLAILDLVSKVKMMQEIRLGGTDVWTFEALESFSGMILGDVLGQDVPVEEFIAVAALHLANVAQT